MTLLFDDGEDCHWNPYTQGDPPEGTVVHWRRNERSQSVMITGPRKRDGGYPVAVVHCNSDDATDHEAHEWIDRFAYHCMVTPDDPAWEKYEAFFMAYKLTGEARLELIGGSRR